MGVSMSVESPCDFAGKKLIVFGCGYVGGEFARQAQGRGIAVTALTRNPEKAAALRDEGLTVVEADLAGENWHQQMPSHADFVLNAVSSGGGGIDGYRHSYAAGMQSIASWACIAKIGTLIYTGSTSVYPQGGGARVDESASTDSTGERAAVLLETEQLVQTCPQVDRWFILRLAGIYGPGRHHVLDQVRAGGVLAGDDSHRLNLVHRDDICSALWSVISAPASIANEIFNVVDRAPVTKAELVAWLADRLGLPRPTFDPARASARRQVVPDRVILSGKLTRMLGWQPRLVDYRAGYEHLLATL